MVQSDPAGRYGRIHASPSPQNRARFPQTATVNALLHIANDLHSTGGRRLRRAADCGKCCQVPPGSGNTAAFRNDGAATCRSGRAATYRLEAAVAGGSRLLHLAAHGVGGEVGGGALDCFVAHDAAGELGLGLAHAGARRAVDLVHLTAARAWVSRRERLMTESSRLLIESRWNYSLEKLMAALCCHLFGNAKPAMQIIPIHAHTT